MQLEEIHDDRINSFAAYLECKPSLVFEIYYSLGVDNFSDLERMQDLKHALDAYSAALSALKMTQAALRRLSSFELATLDITGSVLRENIADGVNELGALTKSREAMVAKSRSSGGRNVKADILAEMVAKIFIALDRPVTFGISAQTSNQPSTPFGRAVQQAINTFHAFELSKNCELGENAFWRYPAKRAFMRYRNANPS